MTDDHPADEKYSKTVNGSKFTETSGRFVDAEKRGQRFEEGKGAPKGDGSLFGNVDVFLTTESLIRGSFDQFFLFFSGYPKVDQCTNDYGS